MKRRTNHQVLWILFLTWTLTTLPSLPILAQTTTATMSGTVKDESGALLPGVTVVVTNPGTGSTRTAVTDDEGRYTMPGLPPGSYEMQAELAGFQTAVHTGINLTVGRHAIMDMLLKVGATNEKVVVTGEASLVETTTSSLAGIVGDQQIRDLPLNGRNFVQLALLETGVVQARTATQGSLTGDGLKMSFHGARADYNNYMMDGTSINSVNQQAIGGTSGQAMGVETIREFQIITSNFSAEFGRNGGGIINVVTKSGTNDLHGSAFYFHRNDNMDARNFFDPAAPPEFKRNQFGFALGGPLRKDKTFVFGGYEGLREGLGLTFIANVPTAAARRGSLPTETLTVNPQVIPYLNLFPLPNGRDFGDGRGEFIRTDTRVTAQDFYQIRVDHTFSDFDALFVRYTIDDSTRGDPRPIPTLLLKNAARNQYVTLEEKKILSPSLLNIVRFGFNRTHVVFGETALDSRVADPSIWFISNPSVPGIGTLGVSGLTEAGSAVNIPRDRLDNVFQLTDTLASTWAAHSLKVGGEVQRIQTNENDTMNGKGAFTFANLRSFLLAQPTTFVQAVAPSDFNRGWRQTLLGLFVQDDVRIRPTFTLNLGLRWEFVTDPREVNGKAAHVNNFLVETSTTVGNPLIRLPKNNIAPRVGFAWDPYGNGKASLRAGFGLFHQMVFRNYYNVGRQLRPFVQPFSQRAPAISFPHPFAGSNIQLRNIEFPQYDNNKLPYMMQYNLTFQQELMRNTVLTMGYVGSKGLHLAGQMEVNNAVPEILADGRKFFRAGLPRRTPTWELVRVVASQSASWYNALHLKVNRRTSGGLQFQSSYTLSHSIDRSSERGAEFSNSSFAPQDPYNLNAERANSAFDLRHVLMVNFTYDLPLGRNLAGAAAGLLRGWQINGIANVTSGAPFSVANSAALDRDRDLSTTNDSRPDLVAGRSNNPVLGGPDGYYDTSAFRLQEAGFYGNLGRHTMVGPGLATFDFVVVKNFLASGEKVRIQFRAELFNLFNRANFDLPNRTLFLAATGVPSGSAGRIIQTVTSARQVQLGLKVVF